MHAKSLAQILQATIKSFHEVRFETRVLQETGWDFLGELEHMYEPLTLAPLPGLSARNWNKSGRAFDIFYRYALTFDPNLEVVREDRGNEVYWRLYLRAAVQDGSLGERNGKPYGSFASFDYSV